ncbi:MAG: Fe2+-dependent dioxygenase [Steroidobacteraceae bacterium]
MLLHIHNVLTAAQVAQFRQELSQVEWVDGRATAGHLSVRVKNNQQIREDHPVARLLGDTILSALERNAMFMSGALPAKIVPPLFNRHTTGEGYGRHIDGSIRPIAGSPIRVRTDLAATLFLNAPEEYEGGELAVEDTLGIQRVKLAAGDLVLYPATCVHQVEPVTRGVRLASFFWIESVVREDARRRMLFGLDNAIQSLTAEFPQHPSILELTSLYHNLIREWGDA